MKIYRVINFSDVGEAKDEEDQINAMARDRFRLIAVSNGRAYFESVQNGRMEGHGI